VTEHRIVNGDVREVLRGWRPGIVQTCVTSPPYFGLRDYGVDGQLGLEPTPAEYVAKMVAVFREVRRVLRDDGTLWLNLGDSYAASSQGPQGACNEEKWGKGRIGAKRKGEFGERRTRDLAGLKPKDLVGIPWRAAMALQADGWYLRSEVVWSKPNPMPESVTDRPTKAHEQVFLLTKSPRYFYDAEAVREPLVKGAAGSRFDRGKTGENGMGRVQDGDREDNPAGRNLRTVWTIATRPSRVSHFAVMAPALAERCIKAGTSEHGCCAACGAPWVRVVEREGCDVGRGKTGHTRERGVGRRGGGVDRELPTGYAPVVHTLSWRPSCPCEPSAPVPCRVLDPFGGSGTTAAVAAVLGRVGSLCEPNQAYIDIVPLRFQEIAKIVSRFARPEPTQPKLKRLKELPQRT
jgi:DNA modification methylase